jgi:hypothetical protein
MFVLKFPPLLKFQCINKCTIPSRKEILMRLVLDL